MRKILLASHGKLASGLKDTLTFFLGENEDVIAINAYVDETGDYVKEFNEFISNANEGEAIIFTDIYGGSVNQQLSTLVLQSGKQIPIITGMNLPVVLSIAMSIDPYTNENVEKMINECQVQLVKFNLNNLEESEEDDFFE